MPREEEYSGEEDEKVEHKDKTGEKDDESEREHRSRRRSRSNERASRRKRSRSRSRKRSSRNKERSSRRSRSRSREQDAAAPAHAAAQAHTQPVPPPQVQPQQAAPQPAPQPQPQAQAQQHIWAQQLWQWQQQPMQHHVGGSQERKRREIYVGNLAIGIVTSQVLTEVFNEALQYLLPEQAGNAYGTPWATPVVSCQMDSSGKFAFIEFRTEDLATAALKLDRLEICGRPINAGRPKGYTPSPPGQPHLSSLPNLAPQQQSPAFPNAQRSGMPGPMQYNPQQQQQQQQQYFPPQAQAFQQPPQPPQPHVTGGMTAQQAPPPHLTPAANAPAAQPQPQKLEAAKQFAEQISLQTGDSSTSVKPAKPIPDEYFMAPASRCLLIEGMVPIALLAARGEREEVERDAKEQCSRIATVDDVHAPSPGTEEIRRRELSRVYVLCRDIAGAKEARLRLHNREYDVNTMVVRCIEESDIDRAKQEGWLSSHSVHKDEGKVHLTNLPHDVTAREVSDFLHSYGCTEDMVSVERDATSDQTTASALVTMSGEHAQARMVRADLLALGFLHLQNLVLTSCF